VLAGRGAADVIVFGGVVIPDEGRPELERLGVAGIFTPGATIQSIVEWVRKHLDEAEAGIETKA
jgi:methylmalonyl-CoA mutase C-terminal domain/subunit